MIEPLRPYPVDYITNPDQETLRALTLAHTPLVQQSAVGNLNKVSRNKNRVAQYTYVIASDADKGRYSQKTIDPEKAADLIARQTSYILEKGELIEVQGFLGLGPRAVAVQWLYTAEGANIAGMQSILAFPVEDVLPEGEAFRPMFRVVYTPDLRLDDMPGRQAILVDMASYTTHIIGPDYFGESKKAALRMLNEYCYRQGGLVLHALGQKQRSLQ